MKIKKVKGNKAEGDTIFKVTMQDEPFSIIKFCVLNNLMAKNEYLINKEKIQRNNNFFYAEAINEAIRFGINGVDMRKWLNNTHNFNQWCSKYFITGENKKRAWNEIVHEIQVQIE